MRSVFTFLLLTANAFCQFDYIEVDAGGWMTFPEDANGFKVPDYSYAGYNNLGIDDLPVFNTDYSIPAPSGGDDADLTGVLSVFTSESAATGNWTKLQDAIDYVATKPLVNGYRGCVFIPEGTWWFENQTTAITVPSGVVIRGAGEGLTIIQNRLHDNSPSHMWLFGVTETDEKWEPFNDGESGTHYNLTDAIVKTGDLQVTIDHAGALAVGDEIVIRYPSTAGLVSAFDDGGGFTDGTGEAGLGSVTGNEWNLVETYYPTVPVTLGPVTLAYWRTIVAIDPVDSDIVTLDAPIYMELEKALSQAYAYKFTRTITEYVGVENLTMDCNQYFDDMGESVPTESAGPYFTGIHFTGVKNGFVRNVTIRNFRWNGTLVSYSKNITIHNVDAIDPHGPIEATERYNFCTVGGQQVFYEDCYASHGRHNWIGNGWAADSGNVIYNCTSDHAYATVEYGHQRLAQGILFDNFVMDESIPSSVEPTRQFRAQMLFLGNHADSAYMFGHTSVNVMAYKCDMSSAPDDNYSIINNPPTGVGGLNWEYDCIESAAQIADPVAGWISKHPIYSYDPYDVRHYDGPSGAGIGSSYTGTLPASLYEQQLYQRLNPQPPSSPKFVRTLRLPTQRDSRRIK